MNFKKIKSEVLSLGVIFLSVCAFKSSFACNYTVPTGSMKSTIEPGDKLLVNKMAYDFRIPFTKTRLFEYSTPKRGEVIVFECPYDSSMTFVKRLIGLPGDTIEVNHGFIRLNGKALDISVKDQQKLRDILISGGFYKETLDGKEYTVRRIPSHLDRTPPVKVTVPDGHYFAMGDNRGESGDSRHWGFVPRENIWGKAKFVYFSFEWPKIRWDRIGLGFS
ncbi:MAG: signal peptidase I [Oligoflexales bacterium]